MVAKKARSRKSRSAKRPDRPVIANDTVDRLEVLKSELERASAEASAIAQQVQEHLVAEELRYKVDTTNKPRRQKPR
jgi:hypothetical protein